MKLLLIIHGIFVYASIGMILGFLWAKFMPRWNFVDTRVHEEGCPREQYVEGGYTCSCPVQHFKDAGAKERDFCLFTLFWPIAVPMVLFASAVWASMKTTDFLISGYVKYIQPKIRKML